MSRPSSGRGSNGGERDPDRGADNHLHRGTRVAMRFLHVWLG